MNSVNEGRRDRRLPLNIPEDVKTLDTISTGATIIIKVEDEEIKIDERPEAIKRVI